ncbi:histidinol dehydrogenase [Aphanothece microscopica]|uniref:histidinol dehydrogenase n=1 Tax=Aphanothece microscopica TaxID=1049561 RepID=UPI0039852F95
MTVEWVKRPALVAEGQDAALAAQVSALLAELERGREDAALHLARHLDGWDGPVEVTADRIDAGAARVAPDLACAMDWAQANIATFARAQRASLHETEVELRPGLVAGQRIIPVGAAGCYVPGGRYAHIASALMTVTTARAAGVA